MSEIDADKFGKHISEFMESEEYKRDSFHWNDMALVFYKKGIRENKTEIDRLTAERDSLTEQVRSQAEEVKQLKEENIRLRDKILWPPNPSAWTVIRSFELDSLYSKLAEKDAEIEKLRKEATSIFKYILHYAFPDNGVVFDDDRDTLSLRMSHISNAVTILPELQAKLAEKEEYIKALSTELTAHMIGSSELQAKLSKHEALLPDDFSESKDWQAGDTSERIEWLLMFHKQHKEEIERYEKQLAKREESALQWAGIAGQNQAATERQITINELQDKLEESQAMVERLKYENNQLEARILDQNKQLARYEGAVEVEVEGYVGDFGPSFLTEEEKKTYQRFGLLTAGRIPERFIGQHVTVWVKAEGKEKENGDVR